MDNVIYKIRNVTNDKFYVGSTTNLKVRFRAHRRLLRRNAHHCKHLQAAWNKYGEDCFKFEIIVRVDDPETLWEVENLWLEKWVGQPSCYNSGRSAEAPMRGMPREANPLTGRRRTIEDNAKVSASLKAYYATNPHPRRGVKHTAETLAKMAENKKVPRGEEHYRYGKTVSEEVRKKISDAQRGKPKGARVYSPEGLARAQENMRRNAVEQPRLAIDDVLAKFPQEILQRYDFSTAVYTGALVRITGCQCPDHGEFSQYAAQFRKGRGCPQCGAKQRGESKSKQMLSAWADPEERSKMLEARSKTSCQLAEKA